VVLHIDPFEKVIFLCFLIFTFLEKKTLDFNMCSKASKCLNDYV